MRLYDYYCWLIVVVVVIWTNVAAAAAAAAVVPNDSELEATAYSISQTNVNSAKYMANSTKKCLNSVAFFEIFKLRGTYVFGYDNVRDSKGNEHFRYEEKLSNGTVVGEYGFTDYSRSIVVRVSYTADTRGFRPVVKIRRVQ